VAISRETDGGFEALAQGWPVLLAWRFNQAAQPEAILRVLTDDGPVTMVGRILDGATSAARR